MLGHCLCLLRQRFQWFQTTFPQLDPPQVCCKNDKEILLKSCQKHNQKITHLFLLGTKSSSKDIRLFFIVENQIVNRKNYKNQGKIIKKNKKNMKNNLKEVKFVNKEEEITRKNTRT